MQRKSVVESGSTRRFVAMALCWGWLAGCSASGVPSNAAGREGAQAQVARDASALATALPPRVGLSLGDIANAQGNLPYCRLYSEYLTPWVLQAYYSDQGFDGCVVAWIDDTGNSNVVNSNYSEDVFRIRVKRSGPALNDTTFLMLGDGVGPVDLHYGTPRENAVDTFALALDASGFPIIAWLKQTSVHFPNVVIRASRWDGQAWVAMGGELNEVASPDSVASKPRLSWNANGQLVLHWSETVNGTTHDVTRTWNGSTWQ